MNGRPGNKGTPQAKAWIHQKKDSRTVPSQSGSRGMCALGTQNHLVPEKEDGHHHSAPKNIGTSANRMVLTA